MIWYFIQIIFKHIIFLFQTSFFHFSLKKMTEIISRLSTSLGRSILNHAPVALRIVTANATTHFLIYKILYKINSFKIFYKFWNSLATACVFSYIYYLLPFYYSLFFLSVRPDVKLYLKLVYCNHWVFWVF